MSPNIKYYIALTQIPGIGSTIAKSLIAYIGSAKEVLEVPISELRKVPGIGSKLIHNFNLHKNSAIQRADKEIEFLKKENISAVHFNDQNYPQRLALCGDAPIVLYSKGNIDWNTNKVISIVGTRKATLQGKKQLKELIEQIRTYNVLIISGLAYGIDIHAHKYALEASLPTACVLAHGLDRVYPNSHAPIAKKMTQNGGMISEFLSQTPPDKQNFPKRNRIIAGLCDALVVVESAKKGGSLISAEIANSYNREVFAFPGRINDQYAEGCNFLIKTNRAALVESGTDIIKYLGWDLQKKQPPSQIQLKIYPSLNKEEQQIYDLFKKSEKRWHIDQISNEINLPRGILISKLLDLELRGILLGLPGNCYELN